MKRLLSLFCLLSVFVGQAQAKVVGEEVTYSDNGTRMEGYIAYDDAVEGERPGVLVVHEWWGHNDYARDRARQLAGLGYTALAVDMYGEGKQADHPKTAGKFAGEIRNNMAAAEARFKAAMETLQQHDTVDPERIGAIGYCFGGGIVLEMARRGFDLDAVASFHGSLTTQNPAEKGDIEGSVLVANGAEDPMTKSEHIEAFKAEMESAGVDYRFMNFPGAKHSFTNPQADQYAEKFGLPLGYDAVADQASWRAMKKMFEKAFEE